MSGTVTVFVVSPDTRSERRFDLHLSVKQLKALHCPGKSKLETSTGIPASSQLIQVFNSEDEANTPSAQVVAVLNEEERPLGFYGLRDWQTLKVTDTSPAGASLAGQFSDVSQVEKFEISEEEYARRQDTLPAYKQRNKLGRFADDKSTPPASDPSSVQLPDIEIGQRCEVEPGDEGGLHKRGVVRFVGPTEFGNKLGVWVGIQYDEPVGKNNGTVNGKSYFTCPTGYGAFVRPERVRVGDYPPVDLEDELEEM